MTGPSEVLSLPTQVRRSLVRTLAERPWPPPRKDERDEILLLTAKRILRELADEPPLGFPDCADWLLVVPDENAPGLRSEAIDARLLVAGRSQWDALGEATRAAVESFAVLLRLEIAGESPAAWADRLPDAAPAADELAATLGAKAPAVSARLQAPGFGEIHLLHVWTLGPDGPLHAPDVSGILALRAPG